MVSAGPIGFGIIFIFLSSLSFIILPLWIFKGSGAVHARRIIGSIFLFIIVACWIIFLITGANNEAGLVSLLIGVITSFITLFVPALHKGIVEKYENT